jgi:hypothetical protein
MFAIGADSDNPADGERGGPTLQYLFGRIFTGFGCVDFYIPLPTSLYVVSHWIHYLVRILTASSSPLAANATYLQALIVAEIDIDAESGENGGVIGYIYYISRALLG